ncbi:patatin-like phospholipase family protein [Corynebacterium epidermidicanis]|uniref:Putative esterase of the alpha-beta hydrolase superfamily n=1 Tax=Corynebacterium epidermidicanis TaxID=1050174 RepID=A0A0G3GQF0_9CORY|nr:DUF6363 domain-containing protein [Corynebacterium epidermidicanis]AKK02785.1 putative esterase of the alpha-beta hydrolase superfamily [Corynebacterium epidermidicanis]
MSRNKTQDASVRVREAFVETPAHRAAGGWVSLLRGRGYFDAEYLYETSTGADQPFPFDFDAFHANTTPFRIGAVRADTGEMTYWGREDITDNASLVRRVRASSTMPGLMRTPIIDGHPYVDGALGPTGGFPIDAALDDGFTTFLVVMSRARSYVKSPVTRPGLVWQTFRRFPAVAEAIIQRPERYNNTRTQLFELEANHSAYLYCPTDLTVSNRERNLAKLQASYRAGERQAELEWPDILAFLERHSE